MTRALTPVVMPAFTSVASIGPDTNVHAHLGAVRARASIGMFARTESEHGR